MKQNLGLFFIVLCLSPFWSCKPSRSFSENEISIVPQVRQMTLGESSFRIRKSTKFVVENIEQEAIATELAKMFEKS